jgi:hypothetical protein
MLYLLGTHPSVAQVVHTGRLSGTYSLIHYYHEK